ncbi:MAG: protease pro-enzyme activation domain-containing protein [Acidianus hospitalis]
MTSSSSQVYYISTNSPKYDILPGSIYVQPLPKNCTLPFAVLLNFTNYSKLICITCKLAKHCESKYLTPCQFREDFYPSKSYVHRLIDYLESFGIKFTGCYGLILTFNGTVGEIEKAFNTELNVYYYPCKNIYWHGLLGVGLSLRFHEFVFNLSSSCPLFPSPCRLRELNHSL